jgi:hypothetical protein
MMRSIGLLARKQRSKALPQKSHKNADERAGMMQM